MKKVAMKKKLHFLKQYPQRQSLHSTQLSNLEVNLGSLILFSCPSFWPKQMRPIFKVQLICPCTQSQYFCFLGNSCTQLRWRGSVQKSLGRLLNLRCRNLVLAILVCYVWSNLLVPWCLWISLAFFLGSLWSKNKEKKQGWFDFEVNKRCRYDSVTKRNPAPKLDLSGLWYKILSMGYVPMFSKTKSKPNPIE